MTQEEMGRPLPEKNMLFCPLLCMLTFWAARYHYKFQHAAVLALGKEAYWYTNPISDKKCQQRVNNSHCGSLINAPMSARPSKSIFNICRSRPLFCHLTLGDLMRRRSVYKYERRSSGRTESCEPGLEVCSYEL
ncbi:hypothetical protein T4C_3841 [Trichinella pseudospiralis]|uniref:Uncharacterized protein n=1 Tax=Trichinella pseudospiralis TaxID=6337 RepID=A0A0V1JPM1_TRIPS|nr:hypothetical protein T4C_3841 [Trichinella pseudospiralis]